MASLADPNDYSQITGNAPEHVKEAALVWYKLLQGHQFVGFGYHVRRKLRILEVSAEPLPDDLQVECTKMICEIRIAPGEPQRRGLPRLHHTTGCVMKLYSFRDVQRSRIPGSCCVLFLMDE